MDNTYIDLLDFSIYDICFFHKNQPTWRIAMYQKELAVTLMVNNTDKNMRKKIRFPPCRYLSPLH